MVLVKVGQSYLGRTFDRCEACSDVALDAIIQSALYVLARSVPDALGQSAESSGFAYRLRVRLDDEEGREIAADDVEAEQQLNLREANDLDLEPLEQGRGDLEVAPATAFDADAADGAAADRAAGMKAHAVLGNFQAMLDRIVLEPGAPDAVSGLIAGRLFGFERLIGPFEVLVSPC